MKRDLKSNLPEMEMAIAEVDAIMTRLEQLAGDDPILYGQAMGKLRENIRRAGAAAKETEELFQFTDLQDFRVQFLEFLKNLKKVELFNHKYADFFSDKPTVSQLEEYMLDCRWMLPTIKKVFGENSEQYEAINVFASFDFESAASEEE